MQIVRLLLQKKDVYLSNTFCLYQCWVKYALLDIHSPFFLTLLILDSGHPVFSINYTLLDFLKVLIMMDKLNVSCQLYDISLVFKEQPKNANNQIEIMGLIKSFAFQRFRKTFNHVFLIQNVLQKNTQRNEHFLGIVNHKCESF